MAEPIHFTVEKAEEKYSGIKIESSFNGIAVTDEQGNIEYVNDFFLKITGWPGEELIGQSFMKIFPEDTQEFIRECWAELQKGIEVPYEAIVRTKSGEIKYIYLSQSHAEIGGKKRYVSAIKDVPENKKLEDIQENKKLELALEESEDRYRDLFENAIDAMYINDVEGYIQNINKAGLKVLGCNAEDIIGTHVSRWFTPESIRLTMETVRKKALGEPVEDPMIRQVITKNGEYRWAEIRSCVIKKGDSIIGVHGIARDVTENMRLKQELKNSNKQRKLLCYLIKGTRGGKTRTLILRHLTDGSYNAHQLAKALNMDYKTVRHHLGILVKNGIITRDNDGHTALYFLSKNIQSDLNEFNSEFQHDKS